MLDRVPLTFDLVVNNYVKVFTNWGGECVCSAKCSCAASISWLMPRDHPFSSAPPCKWPYFQESVNVISPEMLWVFSKDLNCSFVFFFTSTGVAPWGPVTARGKVWHTAYLSLPVRHTQGTPGCCWVVSDIWLTVCLLPLDRPWPCFRLGLKTFPLSALIRTQTVHLLLSLDFLSFRRPLFNF